jgi:spermidine synthase
MLSGADTYFTEPVRRGLHHQLKLSAIVYSGRTRYQAVDIIETLPMGRTLVLDGRTQSAEADEFIYHEALVHPAFIAHPGPRSVFIAGGGEGATLREVLAHRTVQSAVMADLDGELVELCRRLLPQWHRGAFDDPRATLVFGDAKGALEEHPGGLDVIVMDVTDPMEGGPSLSLFTQDFYRMALGKLAPGGILVTQAGPAGFGMGGIFTAICNTLKAAAGHVHPYRADMLSFGSDWGFAMARQGAPLPDLSPAEVDRRIAARVTTALRFYDGLAHAGLFALPKWLREEMASQRHVISPSSPVFVE